MPAFEPYVPENVGEIMELLEMMLFKSPKFVDETGYFPHANIDTVFRELNEGLQVVRGKLGEERYLRLSEMSERMRAHFEADRQNRTDETLKGRAIIREMMDIVKPSARKS
jgi:hypothetical protein